MAVELHIFTESPLIFLFRKSGLVIAVSSTKGKGFMKYQSGWSGAVNHGANLGLPTFKIQRFAGPICLWISWLYG